MSNEEVSPECNQNQLLTDLRSYFLSKVFSTLWTLMASLGGVVLIIYFASINYMPELDFSSSTSLIVSVSLASLIFSLSIMLSFILPGILWRLFQKEVDVDFRNNREVTWKLSFIKLLRKLKDDSFGNAFAVFVIPALISIIVFFSFALMRWDILAMFGAIFGLQLLYYFLIYFFRVKVLGFAALQFITFCLMVQNLVLIIKISGLDLAQNVSDDWSVFIGSAIFLVLILISNGLVSVRIRTMNTFYWISSIGISVFVLVLVFFKSFSLIPKASMKLFKYGNYKLDSLAVTGKSCEFFRQEIFTTYEMEPICVIRNVHVFSSVGVEYYVSVHRSSMDHKLIIPKSDVVARLTMQCSEGFKMNDNSICEADKTKNKSKSLTAEN